MIQSSAEIGRRVLIVEDETFIAMMLEDAVLEIGGTVVGPAARVAEALALLNESPPDAAILDMNLAGESVLPVAERLSQMRVPYVFSTGYGTARLEGKFADVPVLQKPYRLETLSEVLKKLLAFCDREGSQPQESVLP